MGRKSFRAVPTYEGKRKFLDGRPQTRFELTHAKICHPPTLTWARSPPEFLRRFPPRSCNFREFREKNDQKFLPGGCSVAPGSSWVMFWHVSQSPQRRVPIGQMTRALRKKEIPFFPRENLKTILHQRSLEKRPRRFIISLKRFFSGQAPIFRENHTFRFSRRNL